MNIERKRKKEAKTERGKEKENISERPGQVHFGIYLFVCLWCFFGSPVFVCFHYVEMSD